MARSFRNSGKGGSLLDKGVAALAALSAGFLTYAMPEGLFARLILATHVPDFLAAAHPPLGMKARLAVVIGAALLAYAFVWTLMRALDSIGGKPHPVAMPDEEEEAPRLRRADAHPDAPSRRPILAGRDLGEPAFDEDLLELEPEGALAYEPEADLAREPKAEPVLSSESEPAWEPEPESQFAPVSVPAPAPEIKHPSEPLPAFLVPQEPEPVAAETHIEPLDLAETHAPAGQSPAFVHAPVAEPYDDSEEEPSEDSESYGDDQSLTRLMQRFESGLGRKQQALATAPRPPETEEEAQPLPQERVGHRLRNAITGLDKISAPGR